MYRFSLEPVLSHRDSMAKNLEIELADLERAVSREELSLSNLEERRATIWRAFEAAQRGDGITAAEILTTIRYLEWMEESIALKKKQVKEMKDLCHQKRIHLIEVMKKKKLIEKLKIREFQEYTRDLQKKEGNFLDEISVTRYNDRNRIGQSSFSMREGVSG